MSYRIILFLLGFVSSISAQESAEKPIDFTNDGSVNGIALDPEAAVAARVAAIETPDTVQQALKRYGQLLQTVRAENDSTTLILLADPLTEAVTDSIQKFVRQPDCHRLFALRAKVHVAGNDLEAAIDDYSAAIKRQPGNSDYWHARGELWGVEDAEQAIEDLSTAIRLAPENAKFIRHLAVAYVAAERIDEATGITTLAALTHPEDAEISANLVSLLRMSGHPEKAIQESDRGLSLQGVTAQAYINRASAQFELNRFGDVMETTATGLKRWPDSPPLKGQHRNARRRFLKNHPDLSDVSEGNHRLTFLRLMHVLQDDSEPLLFYRRGQACCQLGLFEQALSDFTKALAEMPDLVDGQRDLARVRLTLEATDNEPPLPDNVDSLSDNEKIILALQTGSPKFVINQLEDGIRKFTDESEVASRIRTISQHWPPLRDAVVSEVKEHESVGKRQHVVTLTFPEDTDEDVTLTVARTAQGDLIGIEFESERMKLGTLTALNPSERIRKLAEETVQAVAKGDPDRFLKVCREAGSPTTKQQAAEFVRFASPLIGEPKQLVFLDTVVELPEFAGDDVLISAIALAERQDGQWITFRWRFSPSEEPKLTGFDFGNGVNLKYSTTGKPNDIALARAMVSSDVQSFYDLIHPSSMDSFGNPQIREMIHRERGRVTGAFQRIIEGSDFSTVRIEKGEYIRESSFDVEYENEVVTVDTAWSLTTLDSYTIGFLFDRSRLYGGKGIGEWLKTPAERDLRMYTSGSAETALEMLRQYKGFEEQSVDSLQSLVDTIDGNYGKLKSLEFLESEFDSQQQQWTIRYKLNFEQRESAGYAVYTTRNAQPNLVTVGFD